MLSIIKNVAKILLKRKSFWLSTFILPIIVVFTFTSLYNDNSSIKIAVINKDNGELGKEIEDKLSQLDGVNKVDISDENYMQALIYHQFEMVITIGENFTDNIINGEKDQITYETISKSDTEVVLKSVLNSEISSIAKLCNNINVKSEGLNKVIKTFRESRPDYEVLNRKDIKPSVISSLGIVLYILFISAAGSCGFLLEDEREGTKDRILMGKIGEKQYYFAQCVIFFIFTAIPSLEYYAVCKLFDYRFGFDNTILLFILALLMSLLAVTFSIMIASIVKNKSIFTLAISTLTVPIFMLSGAFWDFELMSHGLQKIGNALPPRWIFIAVKNLQAGNGVKSIVPMVSGVIALSVLFLLLSIFFTKNKMVLVGQND